MLCGLPSAHAYIDPGTVGLPFRTLGPLWGFILLIAGGAAVAAKMLWRRSGWVRAAFILILCSTLLFLGYLFWGKDHMPSSKKIVVLGLDGLDHSLVRRWMDEGRLPNLERLARSGVFRPFKTDVPAQSPVLWTTIATGSQPGQHGLFDFLERDPETYLPRLAVNRSRPSAGSFEKVRKAPAFWEITSSRKIPTVILRFPLAFPPEKVHGRMLSGMGVPDLRGGLGQYTLFCSGGYVPPADFHGRLAVLEEKNGAFSGLINGPKNSAEPNAPDITVPLRIVLSRESRTATITVGTNQTVLAEKRWSDWIPVSFRLRFFQKIRGQVRFCLIEGGPGLRLYMSPVNFDPRHPVFDISSPSGYASELADRIGPFTTLGMPHDTNAHGDGVLSDDLFLDHCRLIADEQERIFFHELDRFKNGLLFAVFDTADAVQHMFWREIDPRHPLHEKSLPSREAILNAYQRMDDLVGKTIERTGPETVLLLCSDHGFSSFRKAIHLNRWLIDNQTLTPASSHGKETPVEFLQGIDWSRSRAYSIGLGGGIYLNLKGREKQGVVTLAEKDAILNTLTRRLKDIRDPKTGGPVVKNVYRPEDLFSGPHLHEGPDLLVTFQEGYRVSWQTAIGGAPAGPIIEEHLSSWSGDHTSADPDSLPGIFFSNRPDISVTGVRELAPALLRLLDCPIPDSMKTPSKESR